MKRSRLAVAGIAVAALGLVGCTGNPSTKAVAKDIAQSIGLPQAQQDCILAKIDEMSDDQLERLGDENVNATFTSAGGGNAAMQAFIDGMQDDCPPDVTTTIATEGSSPDEGSTATTADSAATTTTTLG